MSSTDFAQQRVVVAVLAAAGLGQPCHEAGEVGAPGQRDLVGCPAPGFGHVALPAVTAVTLQAASISIQPDSCTDRSRSGISEALTAPSTNCASCLPAVGSSASRSQNAPNSGSPSTVCR